MKNEPTIVRGWQLRGRRRSRIGVIAGPCSVESEEQILESAIAVKAAGATALRGGALQAAYQPL